MSGSSNHPLRSMLAGPNNREMVNQVLFIPTFSANSQAANKGRSTLSETGCWSCVLGPRHFDKQHRYKTRPYRLQRLVDDLSTLWISRPHANRSKTGVAYFRFLTCAAPYIRRLHSSTCRRTEFFPAGVVVSFPFPWTR